MVGLAICANIDETWLCKCQQREPKNAMKTLLRKVDTVLGTLKSVKRIDLMRTQMFLKAKENKKTKPKKEQKGIFEGDVYL